MLRLVVVLASLMSLSFAGLLTSPDQLSTSEYDYIIVGGGTAGSVLANRLSEDEDSKILVIEAGSSDFRNLAIEGPQNAPRLINSQFDWNFTTVNVSGLNGRSLPYERGFVLGGSSSINFMAYTRGSRDDFDRWANVTGDDQWTWDSLHPYMLKLERFTRATDGHDPTGELNVSLHGTTGPVGFSAANMLLPTDDRVINATSQVDGFPFNLDYNSGDTLGIGWFQATVADGSRTSSAKAYLAPSLFRPNVDVLVHTLVTRVVQTDTQDGVPVLKGVEFAQSAGSQVSSLNATREVILSAGAVKTPQILMLSGIGDNATLAEFGIETIVDSPDVGQNLQDQPLVTNQFTVNSTDTLDVMRMNTTFAAEQQALWNSSRTGILSLAPSSQVGWLRLPDNSSIFQNITDPSAGPTSAHYEFIFTDGFVSFVSEFPGGNFFTIFAVVVSPTSRGNITLNSTDPFDAPIINPNFYDTEFDIFTIREAIKAARTFMAAPSWDGWIEDEFGAFKAAVTDEQIEQYARNTSDTINHVSCTASMGKTGSTGRGSGVLNSDLTVKGTIGLRVVDASAFPFIPAAHTQVPVYILAERASDIIRNITSV
ncbi:hypothetical protein D9756_005765 [Leucocoprinus leucothites]|uniref:pyranose dehydrogenase (acceptor) n=1 Tax=Leucocoprinus leucothites TaxID=201217 RepID=A0A8H5FZW8_9AGAR|nr:hypothetical protein D9756_005765 [Leucoagaricus leucothites]